MENLDPHLEILLQDFVRLCSEDTAPKEDHEVALNEIALFVYEERLHYAGSDKSGLPPSTGSSRQQSHLLWRAVRSVASGAPAGYPTE